MGCSPSSRASPGGKPASSRRDVALPRLGSQPLDLLREAAGGQAGISLHRGQRGGEHHLREWLPERGPLKLSLHERGILVGGLPVLHYFRNGTTSLGVPPLEAPSGGVAAFNIADGTVISSIHRAVEFKKFLTKIDIEVPAELEVHIVCDNYATHKTPLVKNWLEAHPRFHVHFTPTGSSWLNQVERWFAYLTGQLLQRSVHKNVQALEADIRAWAKDWNENPRPFIWTKTADQILKSITRLMKRTTGAGH